MGADIQSQSEVKPFSAPLAHWLDGRAPESTTRPELLVEDPTKDVQERDRTFRRMLAYADLVAALLALGLAIGALGQDHLPLTTLTLLPLIVLASKLQGLYDRDELLIRKSTIDEAPKIFQLATLYTLLVLVLDGQLIGGTLGSDQALVLWATLFFATFGFRFVARWLAMRATGEERCLFIGDAASYARLGHKLEPRNDIRLVGRMSMQRAARRGDRMASTDDLKQLVQWAGAHRVIIDPQALADEHMLDVVRAAKCIGVRVSLLPRVLDVVGTAVVFDEIEGMTIMGVRRFNLTRSSQLIKRTFDLAGATLITLCAAPLLALIAVLIRLDSPGPVLFRQERVGRDGKRFRICKFRTMCVDAEARKAELRDQNEAVGGLFKIEEDPRVTRVGRILRKTSLDELPQLFNVLAGSMSLVGPRPLVVDEDDQITGYDRRRLALTPGMTGHWQILGSARVPMNEMVKIDYLYVASWSLWSDVKILLRTVPYMLARRNA